MERVRDDITGALGVPNENEKIRRAVDLCAKKGLVLDRKSFKQ